MAHQDKPLAGVIGDPIAHSLSPRLHGHWLRTHHIDGHYIPMRVASEDLKTAIMGLIAAGFKGINVTIPHKQAVFELADVITDTAERIGAANTLTFTEDRKIHADNTDGYGFASNVESAADMSIWTAGPVVVLGAGGSSRAVIDAALERGTSTIRLINRNIERAEQVAADFGPAVTVHSWSDVSDSLQDAALLVNTTSLGMTGQPPLQIDLDPLPPSALVTDLVYSPLQTDLLAQAASRGNPTVDGLGMLLHQAAPGFKRWFGTKPVVDQALRDAVLGS